MEKLGLNEVREKFLSFFESKGHLRMKSASLVPQSDKSLLIINSGMAPLKPYFTGQAVPPSLRVTTCQKCIRTPDIDRVGKTARHGTFFEMLGNFSFGDYFKDEAIAWAWELCTEVFKMPEDRLWVTIYLDDDEAFDIWHNKIGLPVERIVRMDKEDNFWEIGLGPCGPCSEIYFDRGPGTGCGRENCKLGCDCDRYMEFWNLVFTQFDKDEEGNYSRLAKPNIDTGMGLERMAAVMQGVDNIFEVDTIKYILDSICSLAGVKYGEDSKKDVSIRVITDHIRGVTFMISDGILPSNEGRGYVLRRLLRRAARHGRLLGLKDPFLSKIALKVIEVSGDAYSELVEKKDYILKIIDIEENRFYETLDQGLSILQGYIDELKLTNADTLSGENAFRLYDTYGFPLDLTKDILEEQGLSVDEDKFQKEMQSQRERARAARTDSSAESWKEDIYAKIDWSIRSKFVGYECFSSNASIKAIVKDNELTGSANEGDEISVVLDITPFYAESGGQVADTGRIIGEGFELDVKDCKKVTGERFAHICTVISGEVKVGDSCTAKIDAKRRMSTARNHSATHLLHKALRKHLGTHVEQAGSFVAPERLRFDFTHFKAMTKEELDLIEKEVNEAILASYKVEMKETSIDEAKRLGAMALFGEKYGEMVRVVVMGDYSAELCGGTHLENTSQAGFFKIISEGGVAAGVRRIEAVTGEKAYEYIKEEEKLMNELCERLKAHPSESVKKLDTILKQLKDAEMEVFALKSKMAVGMLDELVAKAQVEKGVKYIVAKLDNMSIESLREMGDKLRDKMGTSFVMLASSGGEKTVLVAMASKDAVSKGVHSGNIIKEAAKAAGGSGGGRPDMAQGGIKDLDKVGVALDAVPEILKNMIK
ncbi:MAG: alanine--tRNA ligase [Gracilibacteraceae bacterium]|nr:alanine--tRNA ligase [Gracilibacteraceae bacterium]